MIGAVFLTGCQFSLHEFEGHVIRAGFVIEILGGKFDVMDFGEMEQYVFVAVDFDAVAIVIELQAQFDFLVFFSNIYRKFGGFQLKIVVFQFFGEI